MRNKFGLIVLFLLTLFWGCGKDTPLSDYDILFDGADERAISPVNFSLEGLPWEDWEAFFKSDDYNTLGHAFLDQFSDNPEYPCYGEYAIVINNAGSLKEAEKDGIVYNWPGIDFEKYSLVVGQYGCMEGPYKDQRAVVSGGNTTLYLRFWKKPDNLAIIQPPHSVLFGALYRKLPEGRAKVICFEGK
ncbi:MAG: hypothetical protein ACOX5T_03100 [Candidatus Cryptobacteroides sp.]